MAPISRGSANQQDMNANANMNGHRRLQLGAFDAPPSTMAAQLINDLAIANKPERESDQDDLRRLMSEVSNLENDVSELTNVEEKLAHKHKLIYVFARAVLERLTNDDPFVNVPQLVSQSSEALEIFTTAIKETPAVLEYILKPEDFLQARGPEPLWIWLFPRVLALLGRRGCDSLTEKIKDFFYVCFQVVSRSPKLWSLNIFFFSYLKECISVILGPLQNPSIIPNGHMTEIILSSDTLDYTTYSNQNIGSPNLFLPCTYAIKEAPHAFLHVVSLLTIIVNVSIEAASSFDATPAFQDYLVWILDSFFTAHDLQKRWQSSPVLQVVCKGSDERCFGALQTLLSSLRGSLSRTITHKGYLILLIICSEILQNPAKLCNESTRLSICKGLLQLAAVSKRHDSIRRAVYIHLVPIIDVLLNDERTLTALGNDFQKSALALSESCNEEIATIPALPAYDSFSSVEINIEFRRLGLETMSDREDGDVPPLKRRKLQQSTDLFDEVVGNLYSLIGAQKITDLAGLSQVAESCFAALDDADRCKAIEHLSHIPCAAHGSLKVTRDEDENIQSSSCSVCEDNKQIDSADLDHERCQNIGREAIATFSVLIKSDAFLGSRRPRVLAMFALRKFTVHFKDPNFIDLEKSSLGQWCLKSLRSSMRELRVAAGRTLLGFLCGPESSDTLAKRNRFNAIELLRSFSEEETMHLQETCVLAWGQVGRISNDEELNIVLLRLVSYLGHSNPIISGVAFNEILKLSKASRLTVERMFSPYWGTIAIEAVKDLLVRPQTTQLMADLLGTSVSEFLVLTQTFTLPWLVLLRKHDVIKRISEARKDKDEWLTCMETSNIVAILPILLTQNVPDIEAFVMSHLKTASLEFENIDFTDLLKLEPATQAFHLLKAAGEADDSKKSRIHYALQILARHAPTGEASHGKGNVIGRFLEQHILGLVSRFSEIINNEQDEQSVKEKERCVKAFEELVKVAKVYTRIARPQICACLQSALARRELQVSAFSAWATMLRCLGDSDVESMLESTFAIIIRRWDSFSETTRNNAKETLQYLLEDRATLIENTISKLPSLAQFPELATLEDQMKRLREPMEVSNAFEIFSQRIGHENSEVVIQALVELKAYLQTNQSFLQGSAVSEQPDTVVGLLVRSILDTCVKFNESHRDIAELSAECIGLISCLDSNRVESTREQREMVVVSNFDEPGETTEFVLFILEEVIVKAFLSASDTVWQGFLSYVMQELLAKCDFKEVCAPIIASGEKHSTSPIWLKWISLPEAVQNTLTPFLNSKFIMIERELPKYSYPIFCPDSMISDKIYNVWLRAFVLDLLQKQKNFFCSLIFPPLCRAIRIKDISIASFLLPYVVLHVVVLGSDQHRQEIGEELLRILMYDAMVDSKIRREDLKLCVESVFRVLDYLSRWVQEKQLKIAKANENNAAKFSLHIQRVETVIDMIPPEIISQRAVECKSYARALFYWEQHIRHVRKARKIPASDTEQLERLQDIYTQIDEPDGIEGISAHLHVLDIEQQILGHRKAGRWTAAQSWYEIKLAENPEDIDVQINLLTCLKESGQHDVLLNYVEGMRTAMDTTSRLLPFATEASWATGRWLALKKYTSMAPEGMNEDFNVRVGQALLALHGKDPELFKAIIHSTREQIACSLSTATTTSLGACHDTRLKLHVLTEMEMIAGVNGATRPQVLASLNRRLEAIGAYLNDKQYLLGIRRAVMQLSSSCFTECDIASAWLTSARLARKGNAMHQSFNAVLHASQLKDESATIEHARLLWKEGHHRKAIQNLQGAIENNAFITHNRDVNLTNFTGVDSADQQNFLTARAHLLLAKWLDSAGQTNSMALRSQYQLAAKTHSSWEKGHYYLGRHYNKLLETEKALAPELQAEKCLTGEIARLVIENYLRSLAYGTKYLYQTLPRIITLWLDLGTQVTQPIDSRHGNNKEFVAKISGARKDNLGQLHSRFNKYITRMPAYIFYTALPQIVARIAHPNPDVFKFLSQIIYKVVVAHPQQALWSLLAVCSSNQPDRKTRGATILQSLRSGSNKKSDPGSIDMKSMIKSGERLAGQLLLACNAGDFQGNRTTKASLSKDLGVNQKGCLPSPLAVPAERVLMATLPTLTDNVRTHKAFSRDIVTILEFDDTVLVLSSLQKPRKLLAVGSDGIEYGLMCKPKDDLRKDQRLMEFNSMINRSLKRDAESSRRQLYIKTYAVTPLNEECGLIEWVDGLKTLRDILLGLYRAQGITVDYKSIEAYCDEAIKSEDKLPLFTNNVLGQFPPMFHKWFVQQFPEPSTWFAARLRYTRSCAVMSMVGTILGLGDRHGENILFEEGNGGTFHVDFNCLFEKGLTFFKPEKVPFRLTHNMVDAMGMYGYEGPFRKSSELTLKLLRQHQETLMTILEAFVYDPTLDLLKKVEKKKKNGEYVVPQTAQGVLNCIRRKVKGLLPGESVPLGVEGQVDELIQQATNQTYLAGMYIGWCSFF